MDSMEVFAILNKRIKMHGATPEEIQSAVADYLRENGIDVTKENIEKALGYLPADQKEVTELSETLVQLEETVNGLSEMFTEYVDEIAELVGGDA